MPIGFVLWRRMLNGSLQASRQQGTHRPDLGDTITGAKSLKDYRRNLKVGVTPNNSNNSEKHNSRNPSYKNGLAFQLLLIVCITSKSS